MVIRVKLVIWGIGLDGLYCLLWDFYILIRFSVDNYISYTNYYMFKVYKTNIVKMERLIWKLYGMYNDVKNFER